MSEGVLDDATLGRVEEVLQTACGVTLARSLRRSLETALERAARSRGLAPDAFLRRLLVRESAAVECFIEHAVIGETYFFRHPEHLRSVARLAQSHAASCFQVWSAGCASGEEPYSIAMALLAEGMPEGRFRVLATDVSGRALQRAKEGLYGPWSLRRIEPEQEKRFLVAEGESFSVIPQVRRAVEFRRHNLAVDPPPFLGLGAIFCRNVLIYFPTELAREVLRRFVDALAPGGLLFVSPAEVPLTNGLGLEMVDAEGSVALRLPMPGEARAATTDTGLPRAGRAARGRNTVVAAAPPFVWPTPAEAGLSRSAQGTGNVVQGLAEASRVPSPLTAAAASSEHARDMASAREAHIASLPAAPVEAPSFAQPPAFVPAAAAASVQTPPLERAIDAARAGRFEEADVLAREAAKALIPEAYLLLSMVAEVRGDLNGAVEAIRKALYLEPRLALGHATLVALYRRMERREDAERARQNALRALDGLDDEHPLRGVETMTAGGLRQALAPVEQAGWHGGR
ncbi:Chemotaxis protein methyltransferase CheR [Myxococcus hansupus]|uniref:Chemotaxis protein methyltransferase CheR n=1 Tax=Pseudomyxococcus hansupus TaxID=1297742 RepID=A0A0H4WVL0_9BACT|nr:CheR family methyltransferase [Myxococcus hansupus]AKQ67436.1 Chemotaxis protein methyltransferase CheR [Myxococcus hansupus]